MDLAKLSLQESSTSAKEENMLKIINEITEFPYDFASFEEASKISQEAFTEETIEGILRDCLKAKYIDYPHLGWILRRLAQVGAPGGVEYIIENLEGFSPVIGDAAIYLASAAENYRGSWPALGEKVVRLLEAPIIKSSEYLQMVLVGLFSSISDLNHLDRLTQQFWNSRPSVRREIVLAAGKGDRRHWLYSLRNSAIDFDPWLRRAFAYSCRTLAPTRRRKCVEPLLALSSEAERAMLECIFQEPKEPEMQDLAVGDGISLRPKKRSVFLSYSHKDSEVVDKLLERLEKSGIQVWIDEQNVEPGEDIAAFIKRAIASTAATIFVVSSDSLLSSWVGVETLLSLSHEEVLGKRRLIGCWLDDAFLQRDFVLTTTEKIDEQLGEIKQLINKHDEKGIGTSDLDSEKRRLYELRNNLGKIVGRLRDSLVLDVRDESFEDSVKRLVVELKRVREE